MKVSKFTIFNVPLLIPFLSRFSRFSGALLGWSVEGEFPNYPKMMLAAAPHTSNWDFLMFLYAILSKRVQPNVMGKHTLFWWPLSAIMSFLGVVPIDRTQKGGVVEQGIEYFNSVDKTIILVTPEGTRSYRKDWKSGFYHIAWGAKVPLILCKVNFHTRTIFIGEEFIMTGDYDKDIVGIKEYFRDCVPLKPENFGI
ncbi:MAG: glycerol acyltransferase [Rhodobiaceae bacterium]|nr:glycerol acyltransferase [Rhodobiaceae bacterium]